MKLQVAKWGNSLAVRLPTEYIRVTGLRAGDSVETEIDPQGTMLPMRRGWDCRWLRYRNDFAGHCRQAQRFAEDRQYQSLDCGDASPPL